MDFYSPIYTPAAAHTTPSTQSQQNKWKLYESSALLMTASWPRQENTPSRNGQTFSFSRSVDSVDTSTPFYSCKSLYKFLMVADAAVAVEEVQRMRRLPASYLASLRDFLPHSNVAG